ncbi:alpha/beta-hydrolase [Lophium mytilinum]|uniref:Alpha/beta-hydrolase n=1 Tax=Lophium mytilinum TaxID=390894 RepID=A0A6A6R8U9_9PEZI|nr:alpha/beta-hydrolase [Lophium mytilinum]
MTTTKPSIVLIPGAWHLPIIYSAVEALLREVGYTDTCAIQLPSLGGEPPCAERESDITLIRSTVTERLQQGKDVVVVAHSYACIPAGEAVRGLPSKIRADDDATTEGSFAQMTHQATQGIGMQTTTSTATDVNLSLGASIENPVTSPTGHVLALVFLAGLLDPIEQYAPWSRPDEPYVRLSPDVSEVKNLFYNDLDAEAQDYWYEKLAAHHSYGALTTPCTYVPWQGDFKCVYVASEDDQAVPLAVQLAICGQEGAVINVVKRKAGHSLMLSQPKTVVDIIERVVAGQEIEKGGDEGEGVEGKGTDA